MTERRITWLLIAAMASSCLLKGSLAGHTDYCQLCDDDVTHIACGNDGVSGAASVVVAIVHH